MLTERRPAGAAGGLSPTSTVGRQADHTDADLCGAERACCRPAVSVAVGRNAGQWGLIHERSDRSTSQPPTTRLFPLQTRVIHASAGLRLRVVSGRLWLTQPNMAQDLFLGPGSVIDLQQDWVVIGADAEPSHTPQEHYSEYLLMPLVAQDRTIGVLALVAPAPSWFQRLRKSRIANRVRSGVSVIW